MIPNPHPRQNNEVASQWKLSDHSLLKDIFIFNFSRLDCTANKYKCNKFVNSFTG